MIATLALVLASVLPLAGGDDHPDFAAFGQTLLKEKLKVASVADLPANKLLEQHCVHGTLGLFDVAYPVWALADKSGAENLRRVTLALVDTEARWIDWLGKGEPAAAAPKADVETLRAWIKSWKPAALAKPESAPDKSMFALFGATDAQRAAAKRLAETLCHPDALGLAPKDGAPLSVLFAPTRRDFVELEGYTGLLDPTQQAQLWTKDGTLWTTFWLEWNLVIALEYPPWETDKDFKTGLSMDKFEATGTVEHEVQQAMLALLWKCYGDNDALHLEQAMAMNMAIEVAGECNAMEVDGGRGTTGAQTQPYEKFVPGGDPNGGVLPPIPAAPLNMLKEIPWREGYGKDHFVAALRKGQKNAQKQLIKEKPPGLDAILLRDKDPHFLLVSEDEHTKYIVTAPFFGPLAAQKPYPPIAVLKDYREFFRSYRSAFCWWLQTMGDKSGAEASGVKWKQLMKALAARTEGKSFEDVAQEIYGMSISGKNGEKESLEWRFLAWLGKGK